MSEARKALTTGKLKFCTSGSKEKRWVKPGQQETIEYFEDVGGTFVCGSIPSLITKLIPVPG